MSSILVFGKSTVVFGKSIVVFGKFRVVFSKFKVVFGGFRWFSVDFGGNNESYDLGQVSKFSNP